MTRAGTNRLLKDLAQFKPYTDLSIVVSAKEADIREIKAVLVGPPGTPYAFGFFEFNITVPKSYPQEAPEVELVTTNGGKTRFGPNFYSDGTVCLSILGTYEGDPEEDWSAAQSLESMLVSILSLMSENPYENEPTFEHVSLKDGDPRALSYAAKIEHETLRIAVIKTLEDCLTRTALPDRFTDVRKPKSPFEDLYKLRFLWYYDTYLAKIIAAPDAYGDAVKDGAEFGWADFELYECGMDGEFQYSQLKERLTTIKTLIDQETKYWIHAGQLAKDQQQSIALELETRFQVASSKLKNISCTGPVHVELLQGNPFAWHLVLRSSLSTDLKGGIFKILMVLHARFPEVQPRVKMETPIFHHRVTSDGTVCYLPEDPNDLASHLKAIVKTIEDVAPRYDPRMSVHTEASRLYWGTPDEKKSYRTNLRKSVKQSCE